MKSEIVKPQYIIGSISSGTMRSEDLIPCFLDAVRHFDAERYDKLSLVWQDCPEDEAEDFAEELFDVLNEYAPPYFYFGSHPGDGADYGFWLSESWEDDFDGLKVGDTSEVPADYTGEVLHVSDHGNPTLYTANNGKLTEIWSLV